MRIVPKSTGPVAAGPVANQSTENNLIVAPMEPMVTMTSREIADLIESRHDNVKRTIERLAERGLVAFTPTEESTPGGGKPTTVYRVDKRDSYVVVAQLSPEFTARLVDRWQELEAAATRPVVLSRMDILRMAVDAEQRAMDAEKLALDRAILLEQQKPAIDFVDDYVASTGNSGFREVSKLLCANEREFGLWLESAGIMYRLGGERVPYSQHLNAGRFVVKAGTAKGTGHAFNQAKFTPKGVVWIAGEWAKHQIQDQGGAA
ncbi:Phage antirepressor protein KilAC domain protein [compost metagenome]